MQAKLINQAPEHTFVLVFEHGDEVVSSLERFAAEQELEASRITAIGAFEHATLGYFDWKRKDYEHIPVEEQIEVLSLVGGIALDGGKPKLHAHVVLGRRDGSTLGGHLLQPHVRPTLQALLTDSPSQLGRVRDPQSAWR